MRVQRGGKMRVLKVHYERRVIAWDMNVIYVPLCRMMREMGSINPMPNPLEMTKNIGRVSCGNCRLALKRRMIRAL